MKTKSWAIFLMILVTFLTSTAQLFYKWGADLLKLSDIIKFNFQSILTNYPLAIGILVYVIGATLMIIAFKGGSLSVLYPIVATSYIWVGLFSFFVFHESLSILRWLGIFSIFFGVIFINLGDAHHERVNT